MKNLRNELQAEMKRVMGLHGIPGYQDLMHQVYLDSDVQAFVKKNHDQISHFDLVRSAPRLYEFVNEKNKIQNGQSSAIPGYYPHLVLDDHSVNVTYLPTKQTLAKRKASQISKRVHSVSMSKRVRAASLNNFYYDEDQSKSLILHRATEFLQQYRKHPHQYHKGMYIYGRFGIGKTYLLAALANRLAKLGIETTLVHFPTFANEMKASIQSNDTVQKIDAVKHAPILMLDDVGADAMSAWIRDDVFSVILEYRMQEELSTFFSSNYSMSDFASKRLSMDKYGNREPLKAERIMERVHFLADEYQMRGKNHRNPQLNNSAH